MSLPAPNLDDRTFQDIVDEAKRLIPKYCPEWTNHNLSDPGVALIELFAWMTEMTLFRINQVPDRLYAKFLNLIGVELFPPTPAATDLTFWLSATDVGPVVVPAATQVGTTTGAGREAPVVFMTDEDLNIVQPVLIDCLTSVEEGTYQKAWNDLAYERRVLECFGSDPVRPGDAVYFGFEGSAAGNTLRLDVSASTLGLGIDPDDPPLAWEIWSGEEWEAARVLSDDTGGLNRDGCIVLILPPRHAALVLADRRAYWLRGRATAPAPGRPEYETSPCIQTLSVVSLGGTVRAHHSQPGGAEVLGRTSGDPGAMFTVRQRPVLPRQPGETVRVTHGGRAELWTEVADFAHSGPGDRHFSWSSDTGEVRFGPRVRYPDGSTRQHGAVPSAGAEVAVTGYRYGGGAVGNVGAGTLTVLHTTVPYIARAENLGRATGGVDAESVDNAKLRGPMMLRTGQRAVTARDFERLTLEAAPNVVQAYCLPPVAPDAPVRLLVVPRVDRPPQELGAADLLISDDLRGRITAYLDERRILGTSIELQVPPFVGVSVAARVTAVPGRPADLVRQRTLDALYRFVNPVVGGPDGSGWRFQRDLTVGAVFQLLSAIDGVERVDEVLFFSVDLTTGRRFGLSADVIRLGQEALPLSFAHRVVVQ
ncbi:MAG: putative baseplate assembly protein [Acidimicrobiia bacterium]